MRLSSAFFTLSSSASWKCPPALTSHLLALGGWNSPFCSKKPFVSIPGFPSSAVSFWVSMLWAGLDWWKKSVLVTGKTEGDPWINHCAQLLGWQQGHVGSRCFPSVEVMMSSPACALKEQTIIYVLKLRGLSGTTHTSLAQHLKKGKY